MNTLNLLSVEKNDQLATQVRGQKGANDAESPCTNPELGKWLERFGLPVLIRVLSATDQDFAAFNLGVEFSEGERLQLLDDITMHLVECHYCELRVVTQTEDVDLKADESDSEDECQYMVAS